MKISGRKPNQGDEILRVVNSGKTSAAEAARLFGIYRSSVSRLMSKTRAEEGCGSPVRFSFPNRLNSGSRLYSRKFSKTRRTHHGRTDRMADEWHVSLLKEDVTAWNEAWDNNRRSSVDLIEADLSEAMLIGVNLSGADLSRADLSGANLSEANLSMANLSRANLSETNLSGADLSGAGLYRSTLWRADLDGTNFERASADSTIFGGLNLSNCRGLDSVRHSGPSTLGLDSIIRSKGRIPKIFLRGIGLPDEWITYIPSLVGDGIQFFSCFISYSSLDKPFAVR
jgi:uncharacterized protein YjbI with pentapeptide repeats